ncbi:uncharacterized protein LOC123193497 [Mangifera indica]|uniref:uncharacterized protein LOC123193497 n=1 Tax=Mangifera indica TaxID=29780 RepID=UPI001CFBCE17|nr:uncharacterized protein LOC123193497 [Mangifera indica]
MAKPLLILLFIVLLSHSSLSSARPLLDFALQAIDNGEPAAAAYSLALPRDKVNSLEKEDDANNGEVSKVPCHSKAPGTNMKNSDKEISALSQRISAKYRPLLLNILPKGTVPPSGPSKGKNDVKN